jgi:phage terminase Nu1 subunit (DNA packaging protein)
LRFTEVVKLEFLGGKLSQSDPIPAVFLAGLVPGQTPSLVARNFESGPARSVISFLVRAATMDTDDSKSEILNSWKEVAQYLGRGTRTVQRWEQDLGLPVRRPRGKRHSAVMALRQDIDAWVRNRPQIDDQESADRLDSPPGGGHSSLPSEYSAIRETIRTSRGLRTQTRQLRTEMSLAVHSLVSILQQIRTNRDSNLSAEPLEPLLPQTANPKHAAPYPKGPMSA